MVKNNCLLSARFLGTAAHEEKEKEKEKEATKLYPLWVSCEDGHFIEQEDRAVVCEGFHR
jgi:hypothetical protein